VSEWTDADGGLQERRAKDFLVVAYSTPAGNAAAYYPETNPLVPLDHTAAKSNTPVSKAIVIRVEAALGAERSDGGKTALGAERSDGGKTALGAERSDGGKTQWGG
jgi:hypothetical protein